jgi:TM2 domain-containing membrane protein YozV
VKTARDFGVADYTKQSLPPQVQPHYVTARKNRGIYIILGLFLGCLGAHNFYAGYHGRAVAQLLLTILTGWMIYPLIVVLVWALVEICTVQRDSSGASMA